MKAEYFTLEKTFHMSSTSKNELLDFDRTVMTLSELLSDELVGSLIEGAVDEIMLNPDSALYVRYSDGENVKYCDISPSKAQILIRTVASMSKIDINVNCPIVETEISCINARFSALLPPLCKYPCFCLRSLHALSLNFEHLVSQNFISKEQLTILDSLIKERKNILVCGQTGCGKTSFINSMLKRIALFEPFSRIVCIEDTPELKIENDNAVNLVSGPNTSISTLVKATLRLSPDRIVVGEVRAEEALDLIDALSTGHSGGLASIHAGSVLQCLERLKLLISRNPSAPDNIDSMIALAVNAIIILKREPLRHVSSIALVTGLERGKFTYKFLGENK